MKIEELIRPVLKKITDAYKNSLVNRLVIFTAVVLSLSIISITIISSIIIRRQSISNFVADGTNNLKIVNNDIDEYFSELSDLTFPNDYQQFYNAIRFESVDYNQQVYLQDYVSNIFRSRTDLEEIKVDIIKRSKSYYMYSADTYGGVHILYEVPEKTQRFTEKNFVSFSSVNTKENTNLFVNKNNLVKVTRLFTPIGQTNSSALITFVVNKNQIEKNFGNILNENDDHLIMLSNDNSLLYSKTQSDYDIFNKIREDNNFSKIAYAQKETHSNFSINVDGKKYLALFDVSATYGNKLIRLVSFDDIYESAKLTTDIGIIIGIILLNLSVFLITIIARRITRPLEKLSKEINKFGKGDLNAKTEVKGTDEIAQLQKQFNKMSERINTLITEHYSLEIAEKNAELKALEAEVNPHFLYNALQAISTTALKCGAIDVSDMICRLARTMRYCISGVDLVKVEDEIKNIDNYLFLQKARFGDKIKIVYELDSRANKAVIPKLSLQTLVDNSIKYANSKMSSGLTITIKTVCLDNECLLCVKDDGPGMTRERLSQIIGILESDNNEAGGKSIGLKNLNSRLRIVFGLRSRLYIISGKNGTRTFFTIPNKSEN